MPDLIAACAFIFGTVFGSFLNVVILRHKAVIKTLPNLPLSGEVLRRAAFARPSAPLDKGGLGGIFSRSRCPHCQAVLRWFELIPLLSFIWQRGRCRRCGQPISIQYPLVELTAGLTGLIIFTPLPATVVAWLEAMLLGAIIAVLITLFVIDLKTFLLPDSFIILLTLLVVIVVALRVTSYELPVTS
ncbi:MAG: prepilin peptidase, partial [Candidatus Andersenbacteria bacterium]|nr:prepilin peptidase [Candidatus Andersenbacteria bacterium]